MKWAYRLPDYYRLHLRLGGRLPLLRGFCGLAGALAWPGIAEYLVARFKARNERIVREREMRRDHS